MPSTINQSVVNPTVAARKTKVVLGMSGGVDSSAAAAMLIEQGYEVIGVTLKLWPQDCSARAEDKCCGPQAVMDARSVCHKLNIPYYLVDESADFQKQVIEYFADEYRKGRTPNPCVMCNQKLKFGALLQRARQMGADRIATGHFARIKTDPVSGRSLLYRGLDLAKDQSYFLFSLGQFQLSRTLMPLGDRNKSDSRNIARDSALRTAEKEESMEICFVPDGDYRHFLDQSGLAGRIPGDIIDSSGNVLGRHQGIEFYTIGQRKGLGIATGKPLYVIELNPETNHVVVGDPEDLQESEITLDRCNWIPFEHPEGPFDAMVKIRYNHPGCMATITPVDKDKAHIRMHEPQRAVTPGQACVIYDDDLVVGGGWIMRKPGNNGGIKPERFSSQTPDFSGDSQQPSL